MDDIGVQCIDCSFQNCYCAFGHDNSLLQNQTYINLPLGRKSLVSLTCDKVSCFSNSHYIIIFPALYAYQVVVDPCFITDNISLMINILF